MKRALMALAAAVVTLAAAPSTFAASRSWAAPEIRAVTRAGVLGHSPATFRPTGPLTQAALAGAIGTTNAIQHPPLPQDVAPAPAAVELDSTLGENATVGGVVAWQVDAPGVDVDHVDFAVDGAGLFTVPADPFTIDLDTTKFADGPHQVAVNAHIVGGGYAIAVWSITIDNTSNPGMTFGATDPSWVPVVKSWLPTPTQQTIMQQSTAVLFKATSPAHSVTIKQLDGALVMYLGLGGAADEIQTTLQAAGLNPPAHTGTEAIARLLGLRLDHPASEDELELLPNMTATRAEAAWSFAHVLRLDDWVVQYAQQAADSLSLPTYSLWQKRILTTAVHYVGYPYVWGGTSPTHEVDFGVPSVGGFDCSGFVWRVYKLTSYLGERDLSSVLRGRTTYQMSGEVPHSKLIPMEKLQPGDVMFFGGKGPRSSPSIVNHTAIYMGADWFIQSSDQGVTLLPFDGWYRHEFAWGRRPLREAGLAG
ncbi:MAG TPA: NlpC/P60 family protein [Gaiellaceae bacterium]